MRFKVIPGDSHYAVVDLHRAEWIENKLTKFEAQDLANKLNKENDGRQQ